MKSFASLAAVCGTAMWMLASAGTLQAQDAIQVDASRGGVTFSSGVNSLTIGARAQFRWTVDHRESADTDTVGAGVGQPDGTFSQFDVPRVRLTLSGGAYRPWLKYQLQFELSRTSGEGSSKIKDAVIELRPAGRPYRVAAGQFKVPFGLQQLTSSGRQQFVDRAITDSKFVPGRDMGAMLAGSLAAQRVGYEVGVFNGAGESVRQNDTSHLWAARVFLDPAGAYALSEGSHDAGDNVIYHVAAAVRGGKPIRGRTTVGVIEDADNQTAVGLEFVLKTPRVYSTVESYWMNDENRNPLPGPDTESRGFHAQIGFMVRPRTTEVAVRYARIEGDTSVDRAELSEWRAGGGYFWRGHNLKIQADAGQVRFGPNFEALSTKARAGLQDPGRRLVTGEALSDAQFRLQLQVAF